MANVGRLSGLDPWTKFSHARRADGDDQRCSTELRDGDLNGEHARGEDASVAAGRAGGEGQAVHYRRAGKPLVKVVPLDDPESAAERRFGLMAGRIKVPADFDDNARDEIEKMFSGDE